MNQKGVKVGKEGGGVCEIVGEYFGTKRKKITKLYSHILELEPGHQR